MDCMLAPAASSIRPPCVESILCRSTVCRMQKFEVYSSRRADDGLIKHVTAKASAFSAWDVTLTRLAVRQYHHCQRATVYLAQPAANQGFYERGRRMTGSNRGTGSGLRQPRSPGGHTQGLYPAANRGHPIG